MTIQGQSRLITEHRNAFVKYNGCTTNGEGITTVKHKCARKRFECRLFCYFFTTIASRPSAHIETSVSQAPLINSSIAILFCIFYLSNWSCKLARCSLWIGIRDCPIPGSHVMWAAYYIASDRIRADIWPSPLWNHGRPGSFVISPSSVVIAVLMEMSSLVCSRMQP